MNTLFRRSMALALVCALSGCAMVSPELKPDVPVAGTWNEAVPANGAGVSPTWWTSFGSAELQSLVAEAQVRVAGASLFPVLNLSGGTSGGRTQRVGGAGGATVDSSGDIGLSASYE